MVEMATRFVLHWEAAAQPGTDYMSQSYKHLVWQRTGSPQWNASGSDVHYTQTKPVQNQVDLLSALSPSAS